MRLLESMNRKAIGLGFAAFMVLFALGLLVVGMDPSDTEIHLAFWPALVAAYAVSLLVILRDGSAADK